MDMTKQLNLRYADDTTLIAEIEKELKNLLMKIKEKSEKAGLKPKVKKKKVDHGNQFHHFMANRWETMETVTDFIFLGSKITAAMKLKDTCPWKKSYGKPIQLIKNQRHYFANKGISRQSYVFFQ